MCQVEFRLNGDATIIQCNEDDKMSIICNKYASKIQVDKKDIYFTYNGVTGEDFNQDLTFIEMANSFDKEKKQMIILVNKYDDDLENTEMQDTNVKSKFIICPICKENAKIKIKDFKISIFGCKKVMRQII